MSRKSQQISHALDDNNRKLRQLSNALDSLNETLENKQKKVNAVINPFYQRRGKMKRARKK